MRLVTNTPYRTVIARFHGIDDPYRWSLESPAVFHIVRRIENETSVIRVPGGINSYGSEKWLLALALGETTYTMKKSSSHGVRLSFSIYDYVNSTKNSLDHNSAIHLWNGNLVNDTPVQFQTDKTRYLLIKFNPMTEYDVFGIDEPDKTTPVIFSPDPLEFSYNEKYVRDWANRIDGTAWSAAGRLNRFDSLSEIERNRP